MCQEMCQEETHASQQIISLYERTCRRNMKKRIQRQDLQKKTAVGLRAATAFLYVPTRPRLSPWREETVSGRASFRRHQLDDIPVCAIHRLDVRGRAVEAKLRELSPAATGHPPRHRSTGQSYGRCGPIFGRRVPYRDISIRPHD